MDQHTFLQSLLAASAVLLAAISLGVALTSGHFRARSIGVFVAGNLVLGGAALSVVIFFTGVLLPISKSFYAVIFILCVASGLFRARRRRPAPDTRVRPASNWALWVVRAVGASYFVLYLFNASFPETSPDGASYHLGYLTRYIATGHIYKVETSFYPMLSQGFEMLYLPALLFGGGSACAILHTLFVSIMMLLFAGFAELLPIPKLDLVAGGIMFYVTPVVGRTATTAYIDSAAACVCLAAVYFTLLACQDRKIAHFIFAGVCCSFALSIKISTAPILLLCLFLLITESRPSWKHVSIFLLACASVEMVWLGRNWIWYGNPIVPFGNSLFPNSYVHVSFEARFRRALAHWQGLSLSPSLFVETTVRGFRSQGFIGPLYLVFPVAAVFLLAKRQYVWPVATVFMLLVFPLNLGTRFLEPALPFAALTIVGFVALVAPRLVLAIVVLGAVTCWPSFVKFYAHPYAPCLPAPRRANILHRPSREVWLERNLSQYQMIKFLNAHLPMDAHVLAQSGLPRLYVRPNIRTWWETAENERLSNCLLMALEPKLYPLVWVNIVPSPATVAKCFRISPDRVSPEAEWCVSEIKARTEVAASPPAFVCTPNPYDCQLLCDGNPLTQWRNWGTLTKSAHIDLKFGELVRLTSLELLCSRNAVSTGFHLEACEEECRSVPAVSTMHDASLDRTGEFLAREFWRVGIRYLLIEGPNLTPSIVRLTTEGYLKELYIDQSRNRLLEIISK